LKLIVISEKYSKMQALDRSQ